MTELEYGINVANKFDLLFGDEDPTEALSKAAQPDKKKKAGEKDVKTTTAPGNVLKEKTTKKVPASATEGDKSKGEKERKIEGKGEPPKGGKKEEEWTKSASQSQQKAPRNVPTGGAQQQQRPPRSAPQGGKPEPGKENSTEQRRPAQPRPEGGQPQQRSPAAATGGPQQPRPFRGPRPEGSAPPRRSAPMEHDFGTGPTGPAMTGGDQEVPEQRVGFGGRGGYRGGSSYRGHGAPPRYGGAPREAGAEGAPLHSRGREYDRHSGSAKTGVKPMAKREGGGAYNWGSIRDEAEMGAEAATAPPAEGAVPATAPTGEEGAPVEGAPVTEGAQEGGETEEPKEPQVHEKTLKEWLEEEERNRLRPKYATREANEGEPEQKVFQKMRRVTRENADGMVEVEVEVEVEVDDEEHKEGGNGKGGRGGPFQLVFAPASRPTRGTGEDRPRGGRGGRGGPGGPRGGGYAGGGRGGGPRGGPGGKQVAPPAQDELNFPPLG